MEFSQESPLHKPIVTRHEFETDQEKVGSVFGLFKSWANVALNNVDIHNEDFYSLKPIVIKVQFTVE
jgi:hypothetical protein